MSSSSSQIDLRKGPIYKQMIVFAIPIILSAVIQRLFNIADMVIAGNFAGNAALAAIGASAPVCATLVNFFSGVSIGNGIVSSHFFGADDHRSFSECIHTAFYTSILVGVIITVLGFVFSKPLLSLLNTPKDIMDLSVTYMKIYFLGMPGAMCFNFLYSSSRAMGDIKKPIVYLTVSGVVNVILNVIFVIYFKNGVKGIALATLASQYLSALLMVLKHMKEKGYAKLTFRRFIFSFTCFKKMLTLGLPSGLQFSIAGITDMVVQSGINIFGASYISGFTAGGNIGGLIYIVISGFTQTNLTFIAQNYGNKNYERIKKGIKASFILVSLTGIAICGTAMIFMNPLLRMYTDNPDALIAGRLYFYIAVSTYTLCGIKEVYNGALNGFGKTVDTMIVSIIALGVFRIFWNYTVFAYFKSYESLLVAYPASWILAIILLNFRFKPALKKALKN